MEKGTEDSIKEKITIINSSIANNDAGLFDIYNQFQKSNTDEISGCEITGMYLDNIPGLMNALKTIDTLDPYALCNLPHRQKYKMNIDDRGGEEKFKMSRKITCETMIQRNLFVNRQLYSDVLGTLIGYEVTIPYKRRGYPVDLIGIGIENDICTIKLIELKLCRLNNIECAYDLLLRAMFEISTYTACFKSALHSEKDGLCNCLYKNAVKDFPGITKEMILNARIEKVILTPKSILNELAFDCYKHEDLSCYRFLSIEANSAFNPELVSGDKGKFFDIEEFSV